MQTLPTTFRSDGFDFRQLARRGDVALFEKTKPWRTVKEYEVVTIQKLPAKIIYGRHYPEREAMPSASQFGKFGSSHINLQRAVNAFGGHLAADGKTVLCSHHA